MADKIKLATIEAGGTWGRLGNWLAAGLRPAGFEVELLKRGSEIPETAYRVDSGEADLSVTTTFGAREAYLGKPPYDKRLQIKGIAEIQYPNHWFVNMIRADMGLSSFEDLVKKRPPLRLCLPSPAILVSYPVKAIFKLFGIDPYTDLIPLHAKHCHGDFVADNHRLPHPAGQDQHSQTPSWSRP